ASVKCVKEGCRHPSSSAADEMSESDRSAMHVDHVPVEAQLALTRQNLCRERFVKLDEIDILEAHPDPLEEFLRRRYGADSHDFRVDARLGVADDPGHGFQSMFLHSGAGGHEHR